MGQEELRAYIEQSRQEAKQAASGVKDFRIFDFGFIPDAPFIRPETKRIIDSIVQYHQTGIPRNLIVTGPRGSGKTLTMRYLERALRTTIGLPIHGVNCRIYNSSFKVLAHILKLRPRGYSYSELCEIFEREVPGNAVIVLDEIDLLGEKDIRKDVLYFLSRSKNRYFVVLLSNNPRFLRSLDESTRSSLQPETIFFRNYCATEILEILQDRARTGLRKVDPGLLEEISGLTAKNTNGDVRVAIKTLLHCATNRDMQVQDCFKKAREDVVTDVLESLNEKALLIIKAAYLEPTKLVKSIYQRYVHLSRDYREEPYGYTQFYSTLGYLSSLGMIMLVTAKVDRTFTNRLEPLVSVGELDGVMNRRFQ
jgi:archaeal cell division control protein 6